MNLCLMLSIYAIVCIVTGTTLAFFTDISFASGLTWGVIIALIPLVFLGVIYGVILLWRPELPRCICRNCIANGYDYLDSFNKKVLNKHFYNYRCPKCGREYRLTYTENKIKFDLKTTSDFLPYMEVSKWGRWKLCGRLVQKLDSKE